MQTATRPMFCRGSLKFDERDPIASRHCAGIDGPRHPDRPRWHMDARPGVGHPASSWVKSARNWARDREAEMLTSELRNQIDSIWNDFWSGGLANPLQVIEQITYGTLSSALTRCRSWRSARPPCSASPSSGRIFPRL